MARGARVRWRRVAVVVVLLGAAALVVRVLDDSSDELLTAADTLTSVSVGWVFAAVFAEVLSYLVRGAATAVVLRSGGGRVGSVTLGAAVLAGDAAAYCLPFGFAASGVVMFGVLQRRRVGAAVAGWMFAVCSVLYVGAVTVLTIVAVQIAGDADPVPGLQAISIALLAGLALIGGGYAVLRRPAIRRRITRPLQGARSTLARRRARPALGSRRFGRILRRVGAPIGRLRRDWAAQLHTIRLTPAAGAAAFALMMLCWLADIAVLALAFLALHTTPPWTGLLLAYCAGQIAASMPVTPGGIGVVEGSITLALVAFGGAQTITLAAVLVYRLIAYWGCIPAGGLAWLVLRATSRAPVPPAAGGAIVETGPLTREPDPVS
ncbi:MAG TPA: lysylphosphatidylglycerol synthase transmembrane domain-containing protein [Pseudonocardiaceae bacterium]|nr:lysylphosphatidylglycerol synthase transmembrane domain-containing protein [Pseudonocardiaceae bacterium]